jgi:prophage regulatory protein
MEAKLPQHQILLTLPEVVALTRLSKPTIYKYIADEEHDFPKQVRLGPNRVCWVKSEIDRWIKQRMKRRDEEVEKIAARMSEELGIPVTVQNPTSKAA